MNKFLSLIPLTAGLCFGGVVEIDLSIPNQGWCHDSAALARINVSSFINEGETIESAVLKFTGIQNYKEPEANDALHISLLKLNYTGQGNKDIRYYYDDEASSNLFQVKNDSRYAWIGEQSNLLTYTDNNDVNAKYSLEWKQDYWENTNPSHDWRYEDYFQNNTYVTKYGVSTYGRGALWSHITDFTTDSFNIDLNLATITELMASSGGWIGIGIDADCHYTGDAVLEITTKTKDVPEPGSLSLMVMGLATLSGAFFIRKRN